MKVILRPNRKYTLLFFIVIIVAITLAPINSTSVLSRIASILAQVPRLGGEVLKSKSLHTIPKTIRTTGTMAYEKELLVAQLAVARASILTKAVFAEKAKGTISKEDKSPVTIGDYGAQALIIAAIKHNFPQDEVVGEEEASTLREQKELSAKIWNLVKGTKLSNAENDATLGGPIQTEEDMLRAIDAGNSAGGSKGRIWALDPIDGTKGFLRGGQYAVCLALMVDGDVKVGVLGCPNLPIDDSAPLKEDIGTAATDKEGYGVLFSAVQGEGARSQSLTKGSIGQGHPISVRKFSDVSQAVMCQSVEAGHSNKGDNAQIAEILGVTGKPVQMDSQAKYGSLARGAGDIYLRLPVSKTYQEKIWDHAAGDLIVREAGGQVTDIYGKRLDFSIGRTLDNNKGVVGAPANIHAEVLKAVGEVLGAK